MQLLGHVPRRKEYGLIFSFDPPFHWLERDGRRAGVAPRPQRGRCYFEDRIAEQQDRSQFHTL